MSDSLYNALPDSLRPKNKEKLLYVEKEKIIVNVSQALVQKNYAEIKTWVPGMEQALEMAATNVEKIPYANAIAGFYLQVGEMTDAFNWYQRLVTLGEGVQAYPQEVCYGYMNLSIYYSIRLKQDSAISMLHRALDIAASNGIEEAKRDAYYLYMSIYGNLFLYQQTLVYARKYLESLPVTDKWGDPYTSTRLTMAAMFSQLYREEKKKAYIDSCHRIVREVLAVKKNEAAVWYRTCYNHLGYLHYNMEDYLQSVEYYDSAMLAVYNQPGASMSAIGYRTVLYRYLSLIMLGDGKVIPKAMAVEVPHDDFASLQALNLALYKYYDAHGDTKKALHHFVQYKVFNDSFDVRGQEAKVFEARQKYSVAQKEADIAKLEAANLHTQIGRNRIIAVAVVALLIMGLVFYWVNRRQKGMQKMERDQLLEVLAGMEKEMEIESLRQRNEQEEAIRLQRRDISKNMHDEVASDLAALRFFVAALREKSNSIETRQALARVEEQALVVYQQSRNFMHNLYDGGKQDEYDLFDLLEKLPERFGADSRLRVNTHVSDTLQAILSKRQKAEMFKIIKEALVNCLKHSEANHMEIDIKEQGPAVVFDIKDNGKGISKIENGGLGMIAMRERLEGLGGNLVVRESLAGLHLRGSFPMVIEPAA